jgi:lipoate-protein ligase A
VPDTWRMVDDLEASPDAAGQMATDLVLLDEVAAGAPPALRLYRWSRAALSLGRFQPDEDVDEAACRHHGVDVVRRPTGGRALLHGADLTYAVVMPRPPGGRGSVEAVYLLLAGALTAGLARLGVEAAVARSDGPAGPVCFASQQGADLRVGGRKLCGSAQVHRDGVVLQHGALLLDRLPFDETDLLRGAGGREGRAWLRSATVTMRELGAPTDVGPVADALVEGFAETLDLRWTSLPRQPGEVAWR